MSRFQKSITLFGNPTTGARVTVSGGAGGVTVWSEPVDISRHDGSGMFLSVVGAAGGASCSIDVYTFGTDDDTKNDPAPANDGRSYGYTSMFASAVGLTAGSETLYSVSISPTTRRMARWVRAKLVVAAGINLQVFAQLDIREDL
ncbi:hypothetical protein KJZ99_04115 [bacterium]|nr:hypothetical protein [bacterium]